MIVLIFALIPVYAGSLQRIVVDAESGMLVTGARVTALTYTADGVSIFYETQSGTDGQSIGE
jgi:hypothetical protein